MKHEYNSTKTMLNGNMPHFKTRSTIKFLKNICVTCAVHKRTVTGWQGWNFTAFRLQAMLQFVPTIHLQETSREISNEEEGSGCPYTLQEMCLGAAFAIKFSIHCARA